MARRLAFTKRETLLLFIGASVMHIVNTYGGWRPGHTPEIIVNAGSDFSAVNDAIEDRPLIETGRSPLRYPIEALPPKDSIDSAGTRQNPINVDTADSSARQSNHRPVGGTVQQTIGTTTIEHHAPGWTLFRDIYMSEGTFYVVSDKPRSMLPETRMMISTPMFATVEEDNIRAREPTEKSMQFISKEEAERRWGGADAVWSLEGNTLFVNEPTQFLRHYYHLIAELWLGAWTFWSGAHYTRHTSKTPQFDRVIFGASDADGWRDGPGFNSYILRGAFSGMTIEDQDDWRDRVRLTEGGDRAFHFDKLLLTDRSASFRGRSCGSETQRIASEAYEYMMNQNGIEEKGRWWDPVRRAAWKFAGAGQQQDEKIVITYISRQSAAHRKLIKEDHEVLVKELEALVGRKGGKWELNVVEAEKMTKDEQIQVAAKTTILLGVHGNGLTHLIFMPEHPKSMVIEMFYPNGFAHDYQWTAKSLEIDYRAVWRDTSHSHMDKPKVDYPEGFQGNEIPVDGAYIARLIEEKVEGTGTGR